MSLTTVSTVAQRAAILAALQSGRAITPMIALHEFKCFRLAARIHDLRKSGCPIVTFWGTNGDKRWAIYQMIGATHGQSNDTGSPEQTAGV
jgi:hypothetical protein